MVRAPPWHLGDGQAPSILSLFVFLPHALHFPNFPPFCTLLSPYNAMGTRHTGQGNVRSTVRSVPGWNQLTDK